MEFYIKKITAAETRDLRKLTLRPNQEPEQLIYEGDDDAETVHFGIFHNDKLSGIASIYNQPMQGEDNEYSWRLRGMATSEEMRGKGFGCELMNKCLEHIRSKTGKLFWCNARLTAEGFYEKFGMKRKGEIFIPDGMGEHIIMTMEL